eukprot:GHVS01044771.1.p1 GENE.GHVS01044771.1~~GHVS01044771.1.p1  ORF type:complete len:242 (+),score=55.91 GHVS01044771.1:239-964(+)
MMLPIVLFVVCCLHGAADTTVTTTTTTPSTTPPHTPPKVVSPITIVYQILPECLDERIEVPRRAIAAVARELVVEASGGWVEVKMFEQEVGHIEEQHVISVKYGVQVDRRRREEQDMVEEMEQAEEETNGADANVANVYQIYQKHFPTNIGGQPGAGTSAEPRQEGTNGNAVECQAFVTWMVHIDVGTLTTNCGDPERWVLMAFRAMEADRCVSAVFLDSAAQPMVGDGAAQPVVGDGAAH